LIILPRHVPNLLFLFGKFIYLNVDIILSCRYPVALPHGGRATGSVILTDLHDNSDPGKGSRYSKHKKHSSLKQSDPFLPPWMIDEGAELLHGRRRNHPVLAPSLDIEIMDAMPSLKSMFSLNHKHLHNKLNILEVFFDYNRFAMFDR